jgi:hypothetical protein
VGALGGERRIDEVSVKEVAWMALNVVVRTLLVGLGLFAIGFILWS